MFDICEIVYFDLILWSAFSGVITALNLNTSYLFYSKWTQMLIRTNVKLIINREN